MCTVIIASCLSMSIYCCSWTQSILSEWPCSKYRTAYSPVFCKWRNCCVHSGVTAASVWCTLPAIMTIDDLQQLRHLQSTGEYAVLYWSMATPTEWIACTYSNKLTLINSQQLANKHTQVTD